MDRELRAFVVDALGKLPSLGGRLCFYEVPRDDLDWAEQEMHGTRSRIAEVGEDGEVTLHESVSIGIGRVELFASTRGVGVAELDGIRTCYKTGQREPLWQRESGDPPPWAEVAR